MQPEISQNFFLSAGDANAEGELALTVLANKIIDIATEHANSLGIGNPSMVDLHAGWVLSRLTIEMQEYPRVNDSYVLKTWIEDFNRHFSTRNFRIETSDGKVLGFARSIWLVMDAVERRNLGLSHLSLSPEMVSGVVAPILRQEKHIPIILKDREEEAPSKYLVATHYPAYYTFRFCDLDSYRHVNTVRYVALLLNQFSLEEHDRTMVKRLELSFLHEASYGMDTILLRNDNPDNDLISSFQLSEKGNDSPILFGRLIRIPRN